MQCCGEGKRAARDRAIIKCQFNCVVRSFQSERTGSSFHFSLVHFVRSVRNLTDARIDWRSRWTYM